jgi:hypothetical protein
VRVEIIVPLIVFASLVIGFATPFYFKHRNQRVLYEAIKSSIEKTGEADPKLIDAITHGQIGANADLRRGILLIALALGLGLVPFLANVDFAVFAIALPAGLVGLAYVGLHFFLPREPTV